MYLITNTFSCPYSASSPTRTSEIVASSTVPFFLFPVEVLEPFALAPFAGGLSQSGVGTRNQQARERRNVARWVGVCKWPPWGGKAQPWRVV